ncbi:hypothetical protein Ssed_3019 [Shewanella sediminis HAW-EB3]|uniref:Uncharacterized protein n=1 Tax=Shewanella sediminis (strain HAW-EB3) TaxID=425104 RepID=A8FXQ0_SHESH|nr:hypothetical protein [Shewanella sediminis]ABV37623.1 hypothetical protein Ssed_3019 [Shewanella sediminis HAW-EB3]
MKTIFKSTLLAATVAAVCGTAVAGDISTAPVTYSQEGVSAVITAQSYAAISYLTKAAYAVGDKVTYTFDAGALDTTNVFPAQINVAAVTGRAGMALGLLNQTADTVTYRVTSVNQFGTETGKTTLGATIVLTPTTAALKATAVAGGTINVTVSSETSTGDDLDSSSSTNASRTGPLTLVKTQFGKISVGTELDGTILVAKNRKELDNGNVDSMVYSISQITTTGWQQLVTNNGTVATLKADLAGWDLTKSIGSIGSSAGGTATYDDAKKEVTLNYGTNVITTDTVTLTPPTGTKAVVLLAQDFEVAASYAYTHGTSTGSASVGTADAGEWTLDGAVVNVPYMPYADSITQIMYVTNEGSLDADVSVMAFDEAGNDYDLGVVAVSKAGTVEAIAGAVQTALEAQGFTKGKVSLTVTVNAQDKDISIYAAYNVGGVDRGTVTNSQYKQK